MESRLAVCSLTAYNIPVALKMNPLTRIVLFGYNGEALVFVGEGSDGDDFHRDAAPVRVLFTQEFNLTWHGESMEYMPCWTAGYDL